MHINTSDEDILACLPVLKQLRPGLEENTFLHTIRQMHREGYVLASWREKRETVSVAGFYVCTNLSQNGKVLYIFDLVTSEAERSRGHGKLLMADIKQFARDQDCVAVTLDSGVQRFDAHRFYLNQGFSITSHHFVCTL